jgi:FXSXX-COOH protein
VEAATGPAGADDFYWAPLVDVSQLPLQQLTATDDSILGRSVRRLIASLNDPNGVISAFTSYAE